MAREDAEQAVELPELAQTDEEAGQRAEVWQNRDPLESVLPGLLSSAEIDDYIRLTGMIYPYDRAALKSASYEMHIGGRFIYCEENGEKIDEMIDRRRRRYVILPANSITFVQVEPQFRLPNYIAIRFNLRITHVHRGLLLGTGPLVDPGFHGRLLIPLHNLTASEYYLDTEKALIWVEFTKTTFGCKPKEAAASRERHFAPFPTINRNLSPDEYLFKARGGQPIISSIPGAIARAERSAAAAAGSVRRLVKWATGIGAVSIIVGVLALAALMYSSWTVMQNGNVLAVAASTITKDQGIASEKLEATQKDIGELKAEVNRLRTEIDQLRSARQKP
jgi:deoxycytidine triphosphate deaminase